MSDFTVILSILGMIAALLPKYVNLQTQASGKLWWLLDLLNYFCCPPWGTWDKDRVFKKLLSLTCLSLTPAQAVSILRESQRKTYQHL